MLSKVENPWGLTVEDVSTDSELGTPFTSPDFSQVPLDDLMALADTAFEGLVEFMDDTDVPVAQFQSSI